MELKIIPYKVLHSEVSDIINNIIDFSKFNTTTKNGITCTVDKSNCTCTLNGTATSNALFRKKNSNDDIQLFRSMNVSLIYKIEAVEFLRQLLSIVFSFIRYYSCNRIDAVP